MQHGGRHLSMLWPKCALLCLQCHLCVCQRFCAPPSRPQQRAQRSVAAPHLHTFIDSTPACIPLLQYLNGVPKYRAGQEGTAAGREVIKVIS